MNHSREQFTQRAVVMAAVALLSALTASSTAFAETDEQRKDNIEQQIDDLKEELEGSSDALVDAAVKLKRAEAQLGEAQAKEAAAEAALAASRRRDAQAAAELSAAQAETEKIQAELDAALEREEAGKALVGKLARQAYRSSGMTSLALVLQSESPQDVVDRIVAASTAMREQNRLLDQLRLEEAAIKLRQDKLEALEDRAEELKQLAASEVIKRKEAEAEASSARIAVQAIVREAAAAKATIERERAAEQARLDALEVEQDKLLAQIAARQKSRPESNTGAPTVLMRPVNAPMTSKFGMRFHPILNYWRMHRGLDFGAGCGTPIRAANSGDIIGAYRSSGYGNRIVIDHGRLTSTYNHLSGFTRTSGRVNRGEVIGYVGTTGLSTGCHLHFEVIDRGSYVDPAKYL